MAKRSSQHRRPGPIRSLPPVKNGGHETLAAAKTKRPPAQSRETARTAALAVPLPEAERHPQVCASNQPQPHRERGRGRWVAASARPPGRSEPSSWPTSHTSLRGLGRQGPVACPDPTPGRHRPATPTRFFEEPVCATGFRFSPIRRCPMKPIHLATVLAAICAPALAATGTPAKDRTCAWAIPLSTRAAQNRPPTPKPGWLLGPHGPVQAG